MSTPADRTSKRVLVLLNKIWGGNQSRMAADIGMSQSAVSNVVTGRQTPGRKLLAAISGHPLINGAWLLTGDGDPLLPVAAESGTKALYVAKRLFAGAPEDNGDCLGPLYEVPARYYRPSRYWLRITNDHSFARHESLCLRAGDMVLFDCDTSGWPANISGHPCIATSDDQSLRCDHILSRDEEEVHLAGLELKRRGRDERVVDVDGDGGPPLQPATTTAPIKSIVAVGILRLGGFG